MSRSRCGQSFTNLARQKNIVSSWEPLGSTALILGQYKNTKTKTKTRYSKSDYWALGLYFIPVALRPQASKDIPKCLPQMMSKMFRVGQTEQK